MTTKPNSFTLADIGKHVVFAGFDGGSYSATIVDVRRDRPESVRIAYFPSGPEPVFATVLRLDWGRLTRFGNEKFLALEVL
jgi:hypothetical protein